jgi:AmmeMemoRadiSam system protein B
MAGTWYTEDPGELAEAVGGYLDAVELDAMERSRRANAIIVPHPNLRCGGPAQSEANARVGNPDRVILLAPNHGEPDIVYAAALDLEDYPGRE